MKHKPNEIIFLIVFVAFIWYIAVNPVGLGLPAGIGESIIGVTPGLLVSFLCLKGYRDAGAGVGSIALVGVGVGLALFVGSAYDQGMVTASMLDSMTVAELQTWLIVISALLAGIDYYRS